MNIRQFRADEFDKNMALSEYAFQARLTEEQREAIRERFKPEDSWGIFRGEDLQAKLTIIPLETYIHGQTFQMGGIAGVATWPEKRRGGMVSRLLVHALGEMKHAGQTLSFLHPFSFPFYRKFGWEIYTEYRKYTIPAEKFPRKTVEEGEIRRDIRDIAVLSSIYDVYARRYNGTLARSESWWKERVFRDQRYTAVYYNGSDVPEGYVLYKIENRELLCSELVFTTERARRGLWTYLANHDSMVERGIFTDVPMDDAMPYLLQDPRVQQEIIPYFMGRIVDASAFWSQYPFLPSAEDTRFTLALTDPYAPWNDGVWEIAISSGGQGSWRPSTVEAEKADLTCDIQALSAMMIGYRNPIYLLTWEKLQGSSSIAATWAARLPQATTHLMDHF
ncbi:Enhanced intracellular survival protein [compost metagenome]